MRIRGRVFGAGVVFFSQHDRAADGAERRNRAKDCAL
jgi:hypothetical protein